MTVSFAANYFKSFETCLIWDGFSARVQRQHSVASNSELGKQQNTEFDKQLQVQTSNISAMVLLEMGV